MPEIKPPQPGELWKHFKGGYYVILDVDTLLVQTEPQHYLVRYRPLILSANQGTYARTLENFLEIMDRGEYKGPRFVNVKEVHGHVMFAGATVDCMKCANYQYCDDAEAIFTHVNSLPGERRLSNSDRVRRWFGV